MLVLSAETPVQSDDPCLYVEHMEYNIDPLSEYFFGC
jgi:hypothetical protein